jgi:hypothetical protein
MVDLVESMVRLPWATSVFGVQQMMNLLTENGVRQDQGTFFSVTGAVVREFGSSPLIFGAYQFGDAAQQAAVDIFWDVLQLRAFRPDWIGQKTSAAVAGSIAAARALTPGDNLRLTIALLRNTYGVINLVNQASAMLNLPPGPIDLGMAIDRAYSFGQYSPLWLVEGLGESYADRNWSDVAPVRSLLTEGQGARLPEKSLLMMHAGIGISFAQRIMRQLTPVSSDSQVADALRRFIDLVRTNSRPGYEGPALESLGLVARTWYSQVVRCIDRVLWTIDRNALEFFWHGVGRSAYFTPLNLLPGTSAFQGVVTEAPHELALLSATAGATWAFTLVNIREPEVLFHLVAKNAQSLSANDAFTNGMISTVMMANDMIPGDPYTTALCEYTPAQADPAALRNWDTLVRIPCRQATTAIFPVLQQSGRLGEVFRYQNLGALARNSEARMA